MAAILQSKMTIRNAVCEIASINFPEDEGLNYVCAKMYNFIPITWEPTLSWIICVSYRWNSDIIIN